MNKDEKVTGYVLLIGGIVVMLFATIQLALIVTRVTKPFPTFKFDEVLLIAPAATGEIQSLPAQALSGATQALLSATPIVSPDVINEVLNFAVYFFLMAFAVNMGFKFAELGVQLIRPTTIKVHPKNIESIVSQMPDVTQSPIATQNQSAPVGKTVF